jgi:MtN3 and saliva related transmembrane protein
MKTMVLMGYAAGLFSSVGFMPQMIKGFKTKKVDDVALWQPILLTIGTLLWLIYGIILKDMPLILANSLSVVCNFIVMMQKFLYKGNG